MSKPSIFAEIRTARVERILDAKQSRVLTSPWVRRTLSLVAIISSYAVLATLLIPTPYKISKTNRIRPDYDLIDSNWIYDFRDTTQGSITGIVLGVIPLSTIPLYIIFQDAWTPIPGITMLIALTSIWFVPVAMVLGCIDLVIAIGNRIEIRVKKPSTE